MSRRDGATVRLSIGVIVEAAGRDQAISHEPYH
jgi:hypothetical protein